MSIPPNGTDGWLCQFYFFLSNTNMFFFFSCLIAWQNLQCWIKVVRTDITLLSWSYRKRSMQSFADRHEIICRFSINALYVVEEVPLHSKYAEFLNWEWILDFVRCFFCTYWDDQLFFFGLMWWVIMIDFWMLNQSYTLRINPTQLKYYPFYILLDLIKFCLEFFTSVFMREIVQSFLFL